MKLANLRKLFQDRISPSRHGRWPALMGNSAGVVNAGHGFVYVRMMNNQTLQVYNDRVPRIKDLPVVVGYDAADKPNMMQVLSAWNVYDKPGQQGVMDHHENHEYPNWDTTWIRPEQFLWLLCLPNGFFEVSIFGGVVLRNGIFITVDNQTLDLAAYLPANGARYILIQCDNTGVASAKAGAIIDDVLLLELSDIPAVDGDSFPLCAVKLYDSQVELQRDPTTVNDFVDLRFTGISTTGNDTQLDTTSFDGFLSAADDTVQKVAENYDDHTHPGGGGDASDITFTPAVPADWDGCIEPDFVDLALDQLAERVTNVEASPPGGSAVFQRVLTADLTLDQGECLVIAGYLDLVSYDLNLNGDSLLEIL